jgi:hypothetical protein
MQNFEYDKWSELKKYLLSCKGNNIFIHEVLKIMDDIESKEKEWEIKNEINCVRNLMR